VEYQGNAKPIMASARGQQASEEISEKVSNNL
jgi:hypothetical protein